MQPPPTDRPRTPAETGTARRCLNCGADAPGNFCAACGQETTTDPKPLAATLRDAISRSIGRGGKLRRTLALLLFAPGALTVEHRSGRRVRYLRPLQVYLLASVVVFAAAQVFGLDLGLRIVGNDGVYLLRSARPATMQAAGQQPHLSPIQIILDHADTPGVQRLRAMSPDERFAFLKARRTAAVSWFLLLLVPLLALALGLVYRRPRRSLAEHLVFGLHGQAFLLLALLAEALVPPLAANALSAGVFAYFALAFRRVYGGSWPATMIRAGVILTLYFAIFFASNLLLVFALIAL
jgi:hypothetical protein